MSERLSVLSGSPTHQMGAEVQELVDAIRKKQAPSLDAAEIETVLGVINSAGLHRPEQVYRVMNAWGLLIASGPGSHVFGRAVEIVHDRSRVDRGVAFTYLSTHYRARADAMFDALRRERHAELLFALGYHILPCDQDVAVDIWIDALLSPMHSAVGDDLEIIIATYGTPKHHLRLDSIRASMAARGKGSGDVGA